MKKKKEFTINQVCGGEVNSKVQALSQLCDDGCHGVTGWLKAKCDQRD